MDKVTLTIRQTDDGKYIVSKSWTVKKGDTVDYKTKEFVLESLPEEFDKMFNVVEDKKPMKDKDDERIKKVAEELTGKPPAPKYVDMGEEEEEEEEEYEPKKKGLFGRRFGFGNKGRA